MKKVFSLLVVFMIASPLLGCEQAVVDARMETLCKQDGGMKIYEKVTLPKGQFKYGAPIFFSTWNESGGGYRFVLKSKRINVSKPKLDMLTWNHANLTKSTLAVMREADNKILGTYISYSRVGGAIVPRLGPDPSKSCPANANSVDLLKSIFVPGN